jgi:hypothetical protein
MWGGVVRGEGEAGAGAEQAEWGGSGRQIEVRSGEHGAYSQASERDLRRWSDQGS